jgi:hypothetical protein
MPKSEKHPAWNRLFLVLELACVPLALWWIPYSHLPAPGWAVALIAGAAAAMSVHDDMKGWQKGLWMVVIGAFLITELRAISKDRAEAQLQASLDRQAQDTAFFHIRETQNANFTATASNLTTAITGIQSTLTAANATLKQTHPHADLRTESIGFSSAPAQILSNTNYGFDTHFINAGPESSQNIKAMTTISAGVPDDISAQKALAVKFEAAWKADVGHDTPRAVPPGKAGLFYTDFRAFSADEVDGFARGTLTIYFLSRMEYSDSTGRWRSDWCTALQTEKGVLSVIVAHPCPLFSRQRYAVRQ